VLLILVAILLPGWVRNISPLFAAQDQTQPVELAGDVAQYLINVPGQMASMYLLLAMGFALALRCGAVDLSVWAVAGVGGVVAVRLMNLGASTPLAFAAAGVAGVIIGAFHGLAVVRARLPSFLVTAATGIGLVLCFRLCLGSSPVAISGGRFEALRGTLPFPPLLIGRMLIVAGVYSLVMIVLMVADYLQGRSARLAGATPRQARPDRRRELVLALAASGGLAGLGGVCWLIDHPSAPPPSWPIGDLRVVAAAVLAGGMLLGGRGRTMLVGLALPAALLTATIWRQEVVLVSWQGVRIQTLMLICVAIVAHIAIDNVLSWRQGGKKLAVIALALLVGGMGMLGTTGRMADLGARRAFVLAAMGVWLLGVAMLLISRGRLRPRWMSGPGRRSIV
jgi:ribose/xylose/arabinose/galactoside ABC-type transport system permease subunit